MYIGFVKCVCGGNRKVESGGETGYFETCKKCNYKGSLAVADIYVYLIRGKCKELY